MTLDALIRGAPKAQPVGSATAIPATAATEDGGKVARVATIAVATYESAKTEGTSAHHEPAVLAALAHPDALWWRVAVREPGGRTIEVDTPSGWTLPDWQAYAERYHNPGCAVTPVAGLPKPRAPVNLDEALAAACEGVAGITPAQLRGLLSPEDTKDIAAGGIHAKTLKAYALSFAEGLRSGRHFRRGRGRTVVRQGDVHRVVEGE